ncbi:molecular chaperone DnaJ [Sphingomonas sp. Leaf339]|uniref:molecular chaperone DnaJ n=1 Tax=Sphingomonas sp. Leaf339 TaxID=1736343 RepID=UPI0007013509|nr:molecular chaperone DnaJ [Sphingomonas sp. Leaf339]KQU52925.1 molecular chaperone DnaJ [Sphingomonas sp. Leaf339]
MKFLLAALIIWVVWKYLRPSGKRRMAAEEVEARAILGVGPRANAEAIRAAHRRLLAGVHPDRGGSTELARRINAARDTLVGRPAGDRTIDGA